MRLVSLVPKVFSFNSEYPVDEVSCSSCENQQISPSITVNLFPILPQYINYFFCLSMSTITALVACDHSLGNDPGLLNCMCVLTIAMADGTPFDAGSLQGENIVELCVEVGQAHPKGVLWVLVMELVIAFQFSKEMLATGRLVTKATAWCNKPIKLHTHPPSPTHLRAYVTGKGTHPSGTQKKRRFPSHPHSEGTAP